MERIPELELMESDEQARAYSEADFSAPHQMFVDLFLKEFGTGFTGVVLDLGCGPADIAVRFAKAYPQSRIHGVDGSKAMLEYGKRRLHEKGIEKNITLIHGRIPDCKLPLDRYDCIIVNSLLHHLPEPGILWTTIRNFAARHAIIFVMDLIRPGSTGEALHIVEKYCSNEPQILKDDFYNSLLAAYTIKEVKHQLMEAGMEYLDVKRVSDRHLLVSGKMKT